MTRTLRLPGSFGLEVLRCLLGVAAVAPGPQESRSSLDADRLLARAYFEEAIHGCRTEPLDLWALARSMVQRIAEDEGATAQDWVNVAAVELWRYGDSDDSRARRAAERALEMDTDLASAHFVLGVIAEDEFHGSEALLHFERALELAPSDVASRYRYARCLEIEGRLEDAIVQRRLVHDLGRLAGSYRRPTMYRLAMLLRHSADPGRKEEGRRLLMQLKEGDEWEEREEIPFERDLQLGTLGKVRLPNSLRRSPPPPDPRQFTLSSIQIEAGPWSTVNDLAIADVDGDALPDVIVASDTGCHVLFRDAEGRFERVDLGGPPADQVVAAEVLAGDGRCLVVREGPALRLLVPENRTRWRDPDLPEVPGVRHVTAVDFDHDGDVDLALATVDGLHLLRNDHGRWTNFLPLEQLALAADTEIAFLHLRPETTHLPSRPLEFVTTEDIDGDGYVDLVAVDQEGRVLMARNRREDRFEMLEFDGPQSWLAAPGPVLLHDVDGDLVPDRFTPDHGWQRGRTDGSVERFPRSVRIETRPTRIRAADLDGDGHVDLVYLDRGTMWTRQGGMEADEARALTSAGIDCFCLGDLDGVGPPEVVVARGNRIEVLEVTGVSPSRFLHLSLRGCVDRPSGEGCSVEIHTEQGFQRYRSSDGPMVLGVGEDGDFQVLRVVWPNGKVQSVWEPTSPGKVELREPHGPMGA